MCKDKDRVLYRILARWLKKDWFDAKDFERFMAREWNPEAFAAWLMPSSPPHDFCSGSLKALCMPSEHGPEVRILRALGVPSQNIWAIERSRKVWSAQRADKLRTPRKPGSAHRVVHFIQAEEPAFDLIYLDFYGPSPVGQHNVFKTIFGLEMIKPGGLLLCTISPSRGGLHTIELTKAFDTKSSIPWLLSALGSHRKPLEIESERYLSPTQSGSKLSYITTAAFF